jgi:nucleotide-binding universal stress UspA family protein
MYKKILVVVDDRVVTQSAIRQAIEMAHALRADIHFFYVLPNHATPSFELPPVGEFSDDDVHNEAAAHAKNMLAAACELAERAGIQSFLATGFDSDSAQCVSKAAERKHCDLIVVGAEERNPVLQILNGSIVTRLHSVASVPVLVCRDTGSSGGFGWRARVSIRARQRRLELMERRVREKND